MANKVYVNVPGIKKIIRQNHKKFADEYGVASDKVISDYRLLSDRVVGRIMLVAKCLSEEKVIDTYTLTNEGPLRKITLKRDNSDNFVQIVTTGQSMHFMGYTYTIGNIGLDISNRQKTFSNIFTFDCNLDDYDWVKFAEALLDFIHSIIYDRKEAFEAKFNGDLFGNK